MLRIENFEAVDGEENKYIEGCKWNGSPIYTQDRYLPTFHRPYLCAIKIALTQVSTSTSDSSVSSEFRFQIPLSVRATWAVRMRNGGARTTSTPTVTIATRADCQSCQLPGRGCTICAPLSKIRVHDWIPLA